MQPAASKQSNGIQAPTALQAAKEPSTAQAPAISPAMLEACAKTFEKYQGASPVDKDFAHNILRRVIGAPSGSTVDLPVTRSNGSALMTDENGNQYVFGKISVKGSQTGLPFEIKLNGNTEMEFNIGTAPKSSFKSGELTPKMVGNLLGALDKLKNSDEAFSFLAAGKNGSMLATVYDLQKDRYTALITVNETKSETMRVIGTSGSVHEKEGQIFFGASSNGNRIEVYRVRSTDGKFDSQTISVKNLNRDRDGRITFQADGVGSVIVPSGPESLGGTRVKLNGIELED